MRRLLLVALGLVVASGARVGAEDPAPANPVAGPQPPARYRVEYHDRWLGWVRGQASVDWSRGACVVHFPDATTPGAKRLDGTVSGPDEPGGEILVRLRGASPALEATPRPRANASIAVAAGDEPGAGGRVEVVLEGRRTEFETDVPATADGDEVVVALTPHPDGALSGTWSYDADPVTDRNAKGGGRVGTFEMHPEPKPGDAVAHRFSGRTHGLEVWTPRPAEIVHVEVLEDQTGVDAKGRLLHARLARREGWNVRRLLVLGRDLPLLGETPYATPASATGRMKYRVVATPASKELPKDLQDLLDAGRKRVEGATPSQDREALKSLEWAVLEATPTDFADSAVEVFTWSGGTGSWLLQWGDNTATLAFVRDLPGGKGTETTDRIFAPERVRLRVETKDELPRPEIEVTVLHAGARSKLVATRDPRARRTYHTPPIDFVAHGAGRDPGAHGIAAADGKTVSAAVFQGERPFVQAVTTEALVWTKAPGAKSPWEEAVAAAAEIAKVPAGTNPFKTIDEIGWQYGVPLGRLKVSVTLGEHAGLLLLRTAFREMLVAQRAVLGPLGENRALRIGFARMVEQDIRRGSGTGLADVEVQVGAEKVPFAKVMTPVFLRTHATSFEEENDLRALAGSAALTASINAIGEAIDALDAARPDDRERLLELLSVGPAPVVAFLTPRLMRLDPATSRWVPDESARRWASLAADKAVQLKDAGGYAKAWGQAALVGASLALVFATNGVSLLAEEWLVTCVSFAGNGILWGADSAFTLWSLHRTKEHVAFAFGASAVVGSEAYAEARLEDMDWWKAGGIVLLGGAAVLVEGRAALHQTRRAMTLRRGERVLEEFERGRVALYDLPRSSRTDLAAYLVDAKALQAVGKPLSKSQKAALESWDDLEREFRAVSDHLTGAAQVHDVLMAKAATFERDAESARMGLERLQTSGGSQAALRAFKGGIEKLEGRVLALRLLCEEGARKPSVLLNLASEERAWLLGTRTEVDAAAMEALLGTHHGSWEELKSAFSHGDVSIARMHEFGTYRKRLVDGMLDDVVAQVRKETGSTDLEVKSFGSTNLTSDYDLSAYGKGAERVPGRFNEAFRAKFGTESGFRLDTNIYTDPFYSIVKQGTLAGERLTLDPRRLDQARQFVNAQIAHVKYDPKDFARHRERLLRAAKTENARRLVAWATGFAEEADRVCRARIAERLKSLSAASPEGNRALQAANEEYAEVLRAIDEYRSEIERLESLVGKTELPKALDPEFLARYPGYREALDQIRTGLAAPESRAEATRLLVEWRRKFQAEARDAQGIALYFASEAYQCEGTIAHVVGELQGSRKGTVDAESLVAGKRAPSALTASHYLDSFFENGANLAKELAHDRRADGTFKNPLKAAAKTAKYGFRQWDAANQAGLPVAEWKTLVAMTVQIDKDRGNLAAVEAYLKGLGTSPEAYVAGMEKAFGTLSERAMASDTMTEVAEAVGEVLEHLEQITLPHK